MELDTKLFDHYSLRARLQPALLAVIPLVIGAASWVKVGATWPSLIWGLMVTAGFTFFLANLSRNFGKAREPELWRQWGGAPTTLLLRHSGPGNQVLRERWHKHLVKLLGKKLPTEEGERENPTQADEIYEACTRLLINKTRNEKEYPLVYKENVSYGFCRNLLGLKKLGIPIAVIGILASIAASQYSQQNLSDSIAWVCASICLMQLLWWVLFVRPDWVKIPAMNYAQHLLESSENAIKKAAA